MPRKPRIRGGTARERAGTYGRVARTDHVTEVDTTGGYSGVDQRPSADESAERRKVDSGDSSGG
jgi:hypothetical protein